MPLLTNLSRVAGKALASVLRKLEEPGIRLRNVLLLIGDLLEPQLPRRRQLVPPGARAMKGDHRTPLLGPTLGQQDRLVPSEARAVDWSHQQRRNKGIVLPGARFLVRRVPLRQECLPPLQQECRLTERLQ